MARKRFNSEEKALLAGQLPLKVEWQNVTQWHPAIVRSAEIVNDDGWQHVVGITVTAKGTGRSGDEIWITPGHIRLPRE